MQLNKSTLFALFLVTLTARGAPLDGASVKSKRSQQALMGDKLQGQDIKLASGQGDWLAAGLYSASLVQLKDGSNPLKNAIKQGATDDEAIITMTQGDGSMTTTNDQHVLYKDTTSLLFNAGDYWWPNAFVQAALDFSTNDGVSDHTLSPGYSQFVFSWLGLFSLTVDNPTDQQLETYLSKDVTTIPIVIHTKSDGGVLKASHSYSVVGAMKAKKTTGEEYTQVKLRDPCDWLVNYDLADIKGHVDWLDYGCEGGCTI